MARLARWNEVLMIDFMTARLNYDLVRDSYSEICNSYLPSSSLEGIRVWGSDHIFRLFYKG